jgi:hypothetical protein
MTDNSTTVTADDVQTKATLTESSGAFVSTGMSAPRNPERRSIEVQDSRHGKFEVVLVHDEYGVLGALDETFQSEANAAWAVGDERISEAGVETVVRPVES